MSNSPNLSLPFIQPSQAQKHITHNLAIELLDALVHMRLTERHAATPPEMPVEGQVLGVGTGATGAFEGEDGRLACFSNGAWMFVTPRNGFMAWVEADGAFYVHRGGEWRMLMAVGIDRLDGLGINAGWDAVSRLAVASAATLLSHDGAGHQLKINKAAREETASLLFQSDFSGRAEIGLAGSDALSVKVSASGTDWTTALGIDAQDGTVAIGRLEAASIAGDAVQSSPSDETPGRLMRADWGYSRANAVGPVSVADGVPTGAIVEQGETANGTYIRWADGTQICHMRLDLGSIVTHGTGTGSDPYTTSRNRNWDFPRPFVATPNVQIDCSVENVGVQSRMIASTYYSLTTDSLFGLLAFRLNNNAANGIVTANLLAMGRWV